MTIESIGIIGSGIMGSGIAEVAAKAGLTVIVRSRKQETAECMRTRLEKSLGKQVEKGKLEESARDAVLDRVTATSDLEALASSDRVIESVVEDLAVKKQLFAELDGIVAASA